MTEEEKEKAHPFVEYWIKYFAQDLVIDGIRQVIRLLEVAMVFIIVIVLSDESMNTRIIDTEYIDIMMTVSTFLFSIFFIQTKAEPNQSIKFKASYMVSWFVFFITIFFLLMSVLSEVAGNLPVFLFATLGVVINLELYFSYYYFE